MDSLARNGLILFALLALHALDHAVNQPARDVPALGGVVGLLGFGILVVHVLPDWTALSDPYWDFDANPLSWLLLAAPLIAAVSLTIAGFRRLNARPAAIA